MLTEMSVFACLCAFAIAIEMQKSKTEKAHSLTRVVQNSTERACLIESLNHMKLKIDKTI